MARRWPATRTACRASIASDIGAGTGVVFLFAFDLLELNGQDLRREPIELRKRELAKLLRWAAQLGLQLNEHIAEPGDVVFRHACKLGLEGIVSKRLGSRYRSGRSKDWLKFKNPEAPAVKGEAEEDWGARASNGFNQKRSYAGRTLRETE
jgi:bifunctional non-homologous end joining protein LigD